MSNTITISFFQAFSKDGRQLFEDVRQALEGRTLRGFPIKLIEEKEYKMITAIRACLESDVVIFDGSIEDDENRQYYAAIELMKQLDHVLIVSRTMLPFNFEGMRKGGAPQFIQASTTEYHYEKSNEEILNWILTVLERSNLELPRKIKSNLLKDGHRSDLPLIYEVQARLISDAKARMANKSDAFVSYLSKYSKECKGPPTGLPYVETLFETIAKTCKNPGAAAKRFRAPAQAKQITPAEILYFPPGKISLEFMTGQRRFEIVSITESYISQCNSFWIYQTDDYTSSWWTYGELLSLSHLLRIDAASCPDIYIAKPVRSARGGWEFDITGYITPEEKASFLPQLSEQEARELDRIHINSDPDTVAYEQVEKMQKMSKLPNAVLKIDHALTVKFTEKMLPGMGLDEEGRRNYMDGLRNFELYKESIHSYVYTKAFWEDHIAECPECKAKIGANLDPETFMHFRGSYFRTIPPTQYRSIIKALQEDPKEACVLLSCGHKVSVCQSGIYYRWWTVKNDVPSGPCGKLIERIDFTAFNN